MTTTIAARTETKHPIWFASATPLIQALSNGLLFADTDDLLPPLCCLMFDFDGERLDVLATDRRRASIETVQLDPKVDQAGQSPFQFLLSREAASSAVKLLRGVRRDPIVLIYNSLNRTVRIEALEIIGEYRVYETTEGTGVRFPRLRQLFPETSKAEAVNPIGFDKKLLADLGKVQCADASTRTDILTFGQGKPVLIQYSGGPRVLLMPLKP